MEINLLRSVKFRIFDELRYAVEKHDVYKDKVECYHKFPYKERPMMGVVLQNASSSRVKLSPDDYAAALKSHLGLARAENHRDDRFIEWVWEDQINLTKYQENEDLTSQITGTSTWGTNRVFYMQQQPLAGQHNTILADNFRQINVRLNGQLVHAEYVNGKEKMFMLPAPPLVGDTLTVSYWYSNLTPPGRYYVELINTTQFVIDPLYVIDGEQVIEKTTGTELTAQLDNSDIFPELDVLYTKYGPNSNKIYLEKGTDYTLDSTGLITFLTALTPNTTLYADYRWIGQTLGPFDIPDNFHYVHDALPGVIFAFGNMREVGQRMVLIVYDKREMAATVYSGHFNMSMDIVTFTRDPQQLADLTDHVINEIWNNRRLRLMDEGLTITEMDPAGESEEPYDVNTGDLYYKNAIRLEIMTEWKKFVPALYEIRDFNTLLYQRLKTVDYDINYQGKLFEIRLNPNQEPFEVKYPTVGYPRYF